MKLFSYKSFKLFGKAIISTKHEMWVSLQVLVVVTATVSGALYWEEKNAQPEVFHNYFDALIWSFMWYIGDPGKFADYEPITFFGRILHVLIAIIKIAIFAVPAGLVANGFRIAIAKDKRKEELQRYGERMKKSFRRYGNRTLREYLNHLPDGGGKKMRKLNFVPQRIPVARMQIRHGMDIKDIFDVCSKFPEFRLKNQADANAVDEYDEDRFVVEHFPKNTTYGCFIDRKSNVTIVSTSSFAELGVGWFTYYLAQLGGFNYISKELEIDQDELDSFFNLSPKPLYNKKEVHELDKKKEKEGIKILKEKEILRKDFFDDLAKLYKREKQWIIVITNHVKSNANPIDLHFSYTKKDGEEPTIVDMQTYNELYKCLAEMAEKEFKLSSASPTIRYPLTSKNLLYHLRNAGFDGNGFALRFSSRLINFEPNKLVVALRMAQVISQILDNNKGMNEEDVKDLSTPMFGFQTNL